MSDGEGTGRVDRAREETLEELEALELPRTDLRSMLSHFGPGLILMMTGIGTSHLVTAPTAGGRFAYELLWCIPIAYVFKYYGFEMSFRFTNATGRSLVQAYGTAWLKLPLWYVLSTTLVQCAVGQAGRLIAAAAVLYFLCSSVLGVEVPIWIWATALGILSITILLRGHYAEMERITKLLAGILVVSALAVYVVRPAPAEGFAYFFRISAPEGSWLIIAAFLGLLPTGIDVSLQASEWGKAKRAGLGRIRRSLERAGMAPAFDPFSSGKEDLSIDLSVLPPHAQEYCRRWFRIGMIDFGLGYLVSGILAIIFLLLAAVWLYPSTVEGRAVMGEIAQIFTVSVGPWMLVIFLLGALAATYSTAFNYFDGWPRIVAACSRNLFRRTAALPGIARRVDDERRRTWNSEYNIYRLTMVYSLVASVTIIAGIERPVYLVLVASALAYFVAPVIFFLNLYYCITVIPRDSPFYPSMLTRWVSWISLAVFTGLSAILLAARVFDRQLFG